MEMYGNAIDRHGPFDMNSIPKNGFNLPSMNQIRAAYGDGMPSFEVAQQHLPADVILTTGVKQIWWQSYPCHTVKGLAVVWWKVFGSVEDWNPHYTRDPDNIDHDKVPLKGSWRDGSEGDTNFVRLEFEYEDPVFEGSTRYQVFECEISLIVFIRNIESKSQHRK